MCHCCFNSISISGTVNSFQRGWGWKKSYVIGLILLWRGKKWAYIIRECMKHSCTRLMRQPMYLQFHLISPHLVSFLFLIHLHILQFYIVRTPNDLRVLMNYFVEWQMKEVYQNLGQLRLKHTHTHIQQAHPKWLAI